MAVDVTGRLQAGVEGAVGADGGGGVAAVRVVVVGGREALLQAVRVLRQELQDVGVGGAGQGQDERRGREGARRRGPAQPPAGPGEPGAATRLAGRGGRHGRRFSVRGRREHAAHTNSSGRMRGWGNPGSVMPRCEGRHSGGAAPNPHARPKDDRNAFRTVESRNSGAHSAERAGRIVRREQQAEDRTLPDRAQHQAAALGLGERTGQRQPDAAPPAVAPGAAEEALLTVPARPRPLVATASRCRSTTRLRDSRRGGRTPVRRSAPRAPAALQRFAGSPGAARAGGIRERE